MGRIFNVVGKDNVVRPKNFSILKDVSSINSTKKLIRERVVHLNRIMNSLRVNDNVMDI